MLGAASILRVQAVLGGAKPVALGIDEILGWVSSYFSCTFTHRGIRPHIYNSSYILTTVGHTVEKLLFSIAIET